ncbi:uncharacterized protein LOC111716731, partial [Eurytemora carolleeae]|uniref:uncharacterized protein LOC111716731 n=1 Tax=Eurytemora carolleeae TaxID=1294199 RepID=UPI000C7717C6
MFYKIPLNIYFRLSNISLAGSGFDNCDFLVLEMFIVRGGRGRQLAKDGYLYTVNNSNNGVAYWRCTEHIRVHCPGTVKTRDVENLTDAEFIGYGHPHNHPPDHQALINCVFIGEIKEKIREDPSRKIRSIWNELCARPGQNPVNIRYSDARSGLFKHRRKFYPRSPASWLDIVQLPGSWGHTSSGSRFHLTTNVQEQYIIFVSRNGFNVLSNTNELFMDGTFKSRPRVLGIAQLYILMGKFQGFNIPAAFILVAGKTQAKYEAIFRDITHHANLRNLPIHPGLIVTDFEVAAAQAAENVWPQATVRYCNFHRAQSWWRKVQRVGLSGDYLNPRVHRGGEQCRLGHVIRKIGVLGFLPPNVVEQCFLNYRNTNRV